jgi:hypothetical protein
MYYRNAQAAVVVYDVTKAASLEKAKSWVKELQRQANPNIVIALAGNKRDLVQPAPDADAGAPGADDDDDAATTTQAPAAPAQGESLRQVPTDEAQAYAAEAGLLFFETSAKTGEGVVEMFTEIGACCAAPVLPARPLMRRSQEDPDRAYPRVDAGHGPRGRRGCRTGRGAGRQPRGGRRKGERRVQVLRLRLLLRIYDDCYDDTCIYAPRTRLAFSVTVSAASRRTAAGPSASARLRRSRAARRDRAVGRAPCCRGRLRASPAAGA